MGTHDFHYRVQWDQFEAAFARHGSLVLWGDGPVFLEGVHSTRIKWVKGATQQLTLYCEFFSDDPSEDQLRLKSFVAAFSCFLKERPVASYHDPDGAGLAFSPGETESLKQIVNAISVSKSLRDYERFLASDCNYSAVQTLIWMERYLATLLDFWGECPRHCGMVYTRF
jgi:hypothetical protein